MEGVEAAIRLLIEKSWAVGVLLVTASGLAWFVGAHGLAMPSEVQAWSPAGTILGLALIAVSAFNALIEACRRAFVAGRKKRKAAKLSADNAAKNLQTLSWRERASLLDILRSGNERIHIAFDNEAYGLVKKGIMVAVHRVGSMEGVLGELHQSLDAKQLKQELEEFIRNNPQEPNQAFFRAFLDEALIAVAPLGLVVLLVVVG